MLSIYLQRSVVWPQQADDLLEQRRLPRAVRARQGD